MTQLRQSLKKSPMKTAIESPQAKAERLLMAMFPDKDDLKKLTASNRSHEKMDLLRQTIAQLIIEGIPTAVIARILKTGQATIQYHARWLEKNGRIVKPSRFAHWIDAREV